MTRISKVLLICCASYAAAIGFYLWNNFTGECCSGLFGLSQLFAKTPCSSCSLFEHLLSDRFSSVLTLLTGIIIARFLNRIPEKFPTIAKNYFFKKQPSVQTSRAGGLLALLIVTVILVESYLIVNALHPRPRCTSIKVYPERFHVTDALPDWEYLRVDPTYTKANGKSFVTWYWTEFYTASGTSNVVDISKAPYLTMVGNGDEVIVVRAADMEKRIPVTVRSTNHRPVFVKQPGCTFFGSFEDACRVQLRVGEVAEIPFAIKDDDGDQLFVELWPIDRGRDYVEPEFLDQSTLSPHLKLRGIKPTERYLAFSLVVRDNGKPKGSSQSSDFHVTVLP